MLSQHKSHLAAVYTEAVEHARQIREAAVSGVSPTGGRLTPFPASEQRDLLATIDCVIAALRGAIEEVMPGWHEQTVPASLSATRMWVNILLRRLQELVQDLEPGRFSRKYGDLDEETAARLAPVVKQAMEALDRVVEAH